VNINRFKLSDKNESLIKIFQIVKDNPQELISSYEEKWNKLQENSKYFYFERDNYNKTQDPLSFYFITRTCYNGTIRYNSKGEFNTSHHFGRTGMQPHKVEKIINYYSSLMKDKDITFFVASFDEISPTSEKDIIYLNPPYTNAKALYFGNISFEGLLSWVDGLKCPWFMNINGVNSTDNEEIINIPYSGKELFKSGNSSFSRMKGKNVNVGEYFYWRD
jgi:DNA adenine methylase